MSNAAPPPDKISRRRRLIRAFEAKSILNRTRTEKFADFVSSSVGSIPFFIFHVYWFIAWVVLNSNFIPGIEPFDPYPYGLLTMVVSLEAIFLSIFILLSQNRAANIDRLREELDLQVNLIAEEEITKSLEILARISDKLGIKIDDPELTRMLERINTSYIERSLQKQIDTGTVKIFDTLMGVPLGKKNGKQGHEKRANQGVTQII